MRICSLIITAPGIIHSFPAPQGSGIHLRFGTISVRKLAAQAARLNGVYLNELIWREFYMMILWHFPHVVSGAFKPVYDRIRWRNDEQEFQAWCEGRTGYPIVDAGMRELEQTGYMHNRLRMITASFLAKHLLIDWRWGVLVRPETAGFRTVVEQRRVAVGCRDRMRCSAVFQGFQPGTPDPKVRPGFQVHQKMGP